MTLEALSVGEDGCEVRLSFGAPAACVPGPPTMTEGMVGHYQTFLGKADDLSLYRAPESWETEVTEDPWIAEYAPYFYSAEVNDYELLMTYKITVRNGDSALCGESPVTVVAVADSLPSGWRLDEGACWARTGSKKMRTRSSSVESLLMVFLRAFKVCSLRVPG